MRAVRLAAGCLLAATHLARAQEPVADSPAVRTPAAEPFAITLPEARGGVPGTWDLSRDGTNRRCMLTLSPESGEAGQTVRFPAGCRRSVPVTAAIAGWLFSEGTVRLVDRNVRPVLAFARRPDQRSYVARTEAGETYNLVPLDIAAMRPAADPAALPASPSPAPEAAPMPAPREATAAAPASPSAPAPGVYALDRYRNRDVCRLDLGAGPGAPARLVPGCRDSGIEAFDPATWRAADGRMTLVARRGHTVELVPTGDGAWRRHPETGVTFVLRRVEP